MIPTLRVKNREIWIDHSPLVANSVADTYLTATTTGGTSTTLTVPNILGFNVNSIILIEDLGNENAEIVLNHASTAPTMSAGVGTITLTGALIKSHPVGSKVRVILFNQFELSNALTATGSKTVLTVSGGHPTSALGTGLVAVDPTLLLQKYEDREYTTGYYFARYKDSVGSVFGSYTDALLTTGWATNTVGYMMERALRDTGVDTLSEKITKDDCFSWINECLSEIEGKLLHWAEHFSYNSIIGQMARGTNTIAMPTDAYDLETNRSVLALRFGNNANATYLDPAEFDAQLQSVNTTTSRTQAAVAATSLTLTNSYDFDDSGSVDVYISGTKYTITYTGVTRDTSSGATGALTGVPASGTGSITVIIPAGTNVWQNETEGTPIYYTIRNSNVEFWPLADASHDNVNAYMDYAKVVTAVDSTGDTIDYHRYDMVQTYLTWRVECKGKKNGVLEQGSVFRGRFVPMGYYAKYSEKLQDAIKTTPTGTNVFRSGPIINRMSKSPNVRRLANLQDLPNSQQ